MNPDGFKFLVELCLNLVRQHDHEVVTQSVKGVAALVADEVVEVLEGNLEVLILLGKPDAVPHRLGLAAERFLKEDAQQTLRAVAVQLECVKRVELVKVHTFVFFDAAAGDGAKERGHDMYLQGYRSVWIGHPSQQVVAIISIIAKYLRFVKYHICYNSY